MTATLEDIKGMIGRAEENHSHVIIVHDRFDHDNFPHFVEFGQDPREVFKEHYKGDYGADECYDLTMDVEAQLKERRASHWDKRDAPI